MQKLTDFDSLVVAAQASTIVQVPSGAAPIVPMTTKAPPKFILEPTPNIATVNNSGSETDNNTGVVLAIVGLGVGALLLATPSGKKVMGSITGKKKKGGKSKSSLLPVLVIGGAAAYCLYTQNQAEDVTQTPADSSLPGAGDAAPIIAPLEVAADARAYAATLDEAALLRDWPALTGKTAQMTDSEIIALYNYYYNYLLSGKVLHQNPPVTGTWADGGWDTQLYNAIAAIRSKYSLNI